MTNNTYLYSYELKSRIRHYDGFFKLDVLTYKHSLYRGGQSPWLERELFERGDAVVVILFDPTTAEIILVEQIRAGAVGKEEHPWLIEPVAGGIEVGETPEAVARREVLEETGYQIQNLQYICCLYPTPGACSERFYLYYAEVDTQAHQPYAGLDHEDEDIRVIKWPLQDAIAQLNAGRIKTQTLYTAIQWLWIHKVLLSSPAQS